MCRRWRRQRDGALRRLQTSGQHPQIGLERRQACQLPEHQGDGCLVAHLVRQQQARDSSCRHAADRRCTARLRPTSAAQRRTSMTPPAPGKGPGPDPDTRLPLDSRRPGRRPTPGPWSPGERGLRPNGTEIVDSSSKRLRVPPCGCPGPARWRARLSVRHCGISVAARCKEEGNARLAVLRAAARSRRCVLAVAHASRRASARPRGTAVAWEKIRSCAVKWARGRRVAAEKHRHRAGAPERPGAHKVGAAGKLQRQLQQAGHVIQPFTDKAEPGQRTGQPQRQLGLIYFGSGPRRVNNAGVSGYSGRQPYAPGDGGPHIFKIRMQPGANPLPGSFLRQLAIHGFAKAKK